MNVLQEMLESELQEHVSFHKLGALLISKRLKEQGVTLTERQLQALEKRLRKLHGDSLTFTFNVDDDQVTSPDLVSGERLPSLSVDLSGAADELADIASEFSAELVRGLPEIISIATVTVMNALKRDASAMLKRSKRDRLRFEGNLDRAWRAPLNLLETHFAIAFEAGEDFTYEFQDVAAQSQDLVFCALTRLHARACQVSSEVLTLLRAGYADGAHARWRTIHEIAVVGCLISTHGSELAERYLLHEGVESYKAAVLYQQHFAALGYEPMSSDEFKQIKSEYDRLTERFGPDYRGDYGWAASVLQKSKPTFFDIEKEAGLGHMRPFYKMASHNVHANPKGVFFKLGLYQDFGDILLAGPSNTGLTDPAHGSAISLGQITSALLMTNPNFDRIVVCNILMKLQDEIGDAFLKVQESLENQV